MRGTILGALLGTIHAARSGLDGACAPRFALGAFVLSLLFVPLALQPAGAIGDTA
jgi:hypothetical protein